MKLFLKAATAAGISFVILIALVFVFGLVKQREGYRREAVANVASSIGQSQVLAGPVLVLPYTEVRTVDVRDDKGQGSQQEKTVEGREIIFPKTLHVAGNLHPDVRKRGTHEVRIYQWQGEIRGEFAPDALPPAAAHPGRRYGQPFLSWGISDVRGLRGTPQLLLDGSAKSLSQGSGLSGRSGVHLMLEEMPAAGEKPLVASLTLRLAGTEEFAILPVGSSNDIRLKSSWPHPSFSGILPQHEVDAQGFSAQWQVDALATQAQDMWRSGDSRGQSADLLQVSLLEPVNVYLKAERATKYGILFVVLTFAGFFIFELLKKVPVHPIQYGLVGLALTIFFLLLLSLSEHIRFALAYLVAALACLGLIGVYLAAVLRSGKSALGFVAMLATLYGALYGLLILEDNALLVGSGLLFVILAAIMFFTRKLDWYALGK